MPNATEKRKCPGCQSAMSRVFSKDVELDWCQFCGGIWCDSGELKQVTGSAEQVADGRGQPLPCAACGTPMTPGTLSGCQVEHCGKCAGIYLSPGELDEIAGGKVSLLHIPPPQREEVDFTCAGCGARLPLAESYATSHGLACSKCVNLVDMGDVSPYVPANRVWEKDLMRAASGGYRQSGWDNGGNGSSAADAVGLGLQVLSMFLG